MHPLNATIDLDATRDKVWGILTATQAYNNAYPARRGARRDRRVSAAFAARRGPRSGLP